MSNESHIVFEALPYRENCCLIVYMDDIVLTGNDEEKILELKIMFASEFKTKDLGNLKYFLGWKLQDPKRNHYITKKVCN